MEDYPSAHEIDIDQPANASMRLDRELRPQEARQTLSETQETRGCVGVSDTTHLPRGVHIMNANGHHH